MEKFKLPPINFKPVRLPWSQPSFHIFTGKMEKVLDPTETESQLCFNRTVMLRGEAPPLHIHTKEDEFWIILRGKMRFWFGSKNLEGCLVEDAVEGSVVVLPKNIPHSFTPITEETEFLSSFCPGCLQNIFSEIGGTGVRDDIKHAELFNRYGVFFVGPIPSLNKGK
ncbi:cupin domain-containing protein [Burkholderia cenocepacia]|uniref:cupin domain-containing protein n=1 Tax=Burkholderia cenocepacia TaxID=95486 RepID=UPI002AB7BABF|nr:cupin domain-containing protein [Burkholderia cenocepacia]